MVRNVAVVGHLHHGKTALMDMLVLETHKLTWDSDKPVGALLSPWARLTKKQLRYTDTHILSREREISIKSSPMSLILPNTSGKSHIIHFIDTPGHINFVDEVATAMRLVDGIVLVVDAVEGVGPSLSALTLADVVYQLMVGTEFVLRHALQEGVKITLVVNKIDRLILELRLPPTDAYYKIKHTIEEINTFIRCVSLCSLAGCTHSYTCSAIDPNPDFRLSPENGNVAFASTDMGWCFSLRSFAKMYADTYGNFFQTCYQVTPLTHHQVRWTSSLLLTDYGATSGSTRKPANSHANNPIQSPRGHSFSLFSTPCTSFTARS